MGPAVGQLGHDVRLTPPSYVKPYVKWQKNDTAGAPRLRCVKASRKPNSGTWHTATACVRPKAGRVSILRLVRPNADPEQGCLNCPIHSQTL